MKTEEDVSAIEFHPDGLLLGTGSNSGVVTIWDIREQKSFKDISSFKGQEVSSISFSNKGVLFGCAWRNSEVCRVFDLRKFD